MNDIVLRLVDRLERFQRTWIANPQGQMDFVKLIDDVRQCPSSDHADEALIQYLDSERARLRRIAGIR